MKLLILVLSMLFAPIAMPPVSDVQAVGTCQYGESYSCPECNCALIWTGRTLFCQGINCRTVKIYRCCCCRKEWRVYED